MVTTEKETKKFLDKFTKVFRKDNGDVPVVCLKKALNEAIHNYEKGQKRFEFIISLCSDIRLELTANNETDEQFFQLVSECEESSSLKESEKKKAIKKLKLSLI